MLDSYGLPPYEDAALDMPGLAPKVATPQELYSQRLQQWVQQQAEQQAAEDQRQAQQQQQQAAPPPQTNPPIAAPAPTPAAEDKGVLRNAWDSIAAEFGSLGRQAAAGKAVATGDVGGLAKLAATPEYTNPDITKFKQAIGEPKGIWDLLSNSAKAAVKEPFGAFDSTLQVLTGFIPYIVAGGVGGVAGSAVPVVGNIAGAATAMGLTAADLEAGSKGIALLRQSAQKDGIDLSDSNAVAQWVKNGGAEGVFGHAALAGLTNGAITTLTMGVAGKLGQRVEGLLSESIGAAGPLQPGAANALRSSARAAQTGELATTVVGFGGASALGDLAAGQTPDEKDAFVNAMTLLIPGLLHARGRFKDAKVPELGADQLAPKKPAEAKTEKTELTEDELAAIAGEAEPNKPTPGETATTLEDIRERWAQRLEQSQRPEETTQDQIDAIKDFGPHATALHLVQDVMGEARNEIIAEAKDEAAGRQAERAKTSDTATAAVAGEPRELPGEQPADVAATAANAAPGVGGERTGPPRERAGQPAGDGQVHQGGGGEAQARPAGGTDPRLNEEGVHPPVALEPGGGEPTGGVGGSGAGPLAKPKLPVVDEGGAERGGSGAGVLLNLEDFRQRVATLRAMDRQAKEEVGLALEEVKAAVAEGRMTPEAERLLVEAEAMAANRKVSSDDLMFKMDEVVDALKPRRDVAANEADVSTPPIKSLGQIFREKGMSEADIYEITGGKEGTPAAGAAVKSNPLKQGDNYYLRHMVDTLGFDRKTAKELYAEDPGFYREQVDKELRETPAEREAGSALSAKEADRLAREGDLNAVSGATDRITLPEGTTRDLEAGTATAERALESLSKASDSPLTRVIAHALRVALRGAHIPIEYRSGMVAKDGGRVVGRYSPSEGKIYLDPNGGATARTLMHELVHAATEHVIRNPLNDVQRAAVADLTSMMKRAEELTFGDEHYGFTDLKEFVAEAMSSRDFQKVLSRIPWERNLGGTKSMWQKFKEIISRAISSLFPGKEQTVLHNAILRTVDLFEAPNRPTKATETPAFKKWFGDSKVVDEKGEPLRVFHGTQAGEDFTKFNTKGEGAHFGTLAAAETKIGAGKSLAQFVAVHGMTPRQTGKRILPVYLSIKNPKRLPDQPGGWEAQIKLAKKQGYDGIVYDNLYETNWKSNGGGGDSWIAFYPEQIKSATGNRGTYDPHDPNILNKVEDKEHNVVKGVDKVGVRGSIAYRRAPDKYTFYPRTTSEYTRGVPGEGVKDLTHEQVLSKMNEAGHRPLYANSPDYSKEPQPPNKAVAGYKDGTLRMVATPLKDDAGRPTGQWKIVESDDLQNKQALRSSHVVESYGDVVKARADQKLDSTLRASEARAKDAARGANPNIDLVLPGKFYLNFFNREGPSVYAGTQVERERTRLGLETPESMRPDVANQLKISRIEHDVERVQRGMIDPLQKSGRALMAKFKRKGDEQITDDIKNLVYAHRGETLLADDRYRDTPEAEAQVKQQTEDAKRYVAALPEAYRKELDAYLREWKKVADARVDYEIKHGLTTPEAGAATKARYELYVPFRTDAKSTRGKQATGLSNDTTHPLDRIVNDWKNAIRDNYQNRELDATYEMADKNNLKMPDGSMYFDLEPLSEYRYDDEGHLQLYGKSLAMDPDSVVVKKGGVPYRMRINDPDWKAALQHVPFNDKLSALNSSLRAATMVNAISGGLKTAASPVFAVKNLRDIKTALVQTDERMSRRKFTTSLFNPEVWKTAAANAAEPWTGTHGGHEAEREAYISRRGMAGLEAQIENNPVNLSPNLLQRAGEARRNIFSFEHGKATGVLSFATKLGENLVRGAVFDAAMKSPRLHESIGKMSGTSGAEVKAAFDKANAGKPLNAKEQELVTYLRSEAANIGKNSTVNFEPKGRLAPFVNPFWLFTNARLQGTRTYAERLGLTGIRGGKNFGERLARGNRYTQASAATALGAGIASAIYLYKNDPDYPNMSDYQKDDYFTFGSGKLSLPIPPEIGWPYILGQSVVDSQMNTRWADPAMRQSKAMTRAATGLIQTFWPFGSSMSDPVGASQGTTGQYLGRLVTPTQVQNWLLDPALNTNTFGSPIVTGLDRGVPRNGKPLYAHNADKVSPAAALTASGLHKAGVADVAPQMVQHQINQFAKSQIDFFHMIESFLGEPEKDATGEERPNVFLRTFFQKASPLATRNDIQEIIQHETAKAYDEGRDPKKDATINKLKKAETQGSRAFSGADKMSPEQRKAANAKAERIRNNALKQYNELQQQ